MNPSHQVLEGWESSQCPSVLMPAKGKSCKQDFLGTAVSGLLCHLYVTFNPHVQLHWGLCDWDVLSHQVSFLLIYSFISVWTHGFLYLKVGIIFLYYWFWCSNCPRFEPWKPHSGFFCVLWHVSIIFPGSFILELDIASLWACPAVIPLESSFSPRSSSSSIHPVENAVWKPDLVAW